jgi:hypothetical protein
LIWLRVLLLLVRLLLVLVRLLLLILLLLLVLLLALLMPRLVIQVKLLVKGLLGVLSSSLCPCICMGMNCFRRQLSYYNRHLLPHSALRVVIFGSLLLLPDGLPFTPPVSVNRRQLEEVAHCHNLHIGLAVTTKAHT